MDLERTHTHIMQLPADQAMDIENKLCKTCSVPNRRCRVFVAHMNLVRSLTVGEGKTEEEEKEAAF